MRQHFDLTPEDSSGDFPIDTGFGHYRTTDDEHVRAAANSVNIPAREQRCLDALAEMPHGTAYDVGDWISLHDGTNEVPSNITPRLSSLHRKHLIKKTTFKRRSPMGKMPRTRRGRASSRASSSRRWAPTFLRACGPR